jgi:hypothetical protein
MKNDPAYIFEFTPISVESPDKFSSLPKSSDSGSSCFPRTSFAFSVFLTSPLIHRSAGCPADSQWSPVHFFQFRIFPSYILYGTNFLYNILIFVVEYGTIIQEGQLSLALTSFEGRYADEKHLQIE